MPSGISIGPRLNGTFPEPLLRCHKSIFGLLVEVEARHRGQGDCLLRVAPAPKRILLAHEYVPRLLLDAEASELARERVRVLLRVLEPAHDSRDLACRVGDRILCASRLVLAARASEADPAPERENVVAHRVLVGVVRTAAVLKRTCGIVFR